MKGAVIGSPIHHSLSPRIFKFLSESLAKKFEYEAIEVLSGALSEFMRGAREDYVGLNVTLPHKEAIMGLIDTISPEAKGVGAVNCVAFKKTKAKGYNTDVLGFSQSLAENEISLAEKTSLILGAGGASRAVAYSLGNLGCKTVFIYNKTNARSETLATEFRKLFPKTQFLACRDQQWADKEISLVVNCTPLGMQGFSGNDIELFNSVFQNKFKEATAFDLIYRPERTSFLRIAEKQGLRTIGGLDMLIYQALSSWEIWFETTLEKKNLKVALQKELRNSVSPKSKRIYITGFMGVGKSTVAKIVAQKLNWTCVDIDHKIEKKMGKTIGAIFDESGEPAFRKLESDAIREACQSDYVVIALGGGALRENLGLIRSTGSLVYLSASTEQLAERLKNSLAARPLLRLDDGVSLIQRIEMLLKKRLEQYREAHFEINTDHQSDEKVADKLVALIETESK